MEHSWEFRNVINTDEIINPGMCAMQVEVDGSILVGPQPGWKVCYMEVVDGEEEGEVTVIVYVEREHYVSSVIGWDGRVIA